MVLKCVNVLSSEIKEWIWLVNFSASQYTRVWTWCLGVCVVAPSGRPSFTHFLIPCALALYTVREKWVKYPPGLVGGARLENSKLAGAMGTRGEARRSCPFWRATFSRLINPYFH